jgi:sterol 3beta-glucosyltransferase
MELQYQLAQGQPLPTTPAVSQLIAAADEESPRGSEESDTSLDPGAAQFLNDRVAVEEGAAQREVGQEIERTRREADEHSDEEQRELLEQDPQAAAALREAQEGSEIEVEDRMPMNAGERQRLRRERLGQKLRDVFGLQEMEEVMEEMRCWLLRSVSKLHGSEVGAGSSGIWLMVSAQGVYVPHGKAYLLLCPHAGRRDDGRQDWPA